MEYILTFEDGSSGYLSHHGVKGMKWGVWNDETAARYTLKKGSTIRRFTSKEEAKRGTTLSKDRFYAFQTQGDYDQYKTKLDELPSTSQYENGKLVKEIGLVSLEAIDDVTVAKGKVVLNDLLKTYGDTPLDEFFDAKGFGYVRESLGLDENTTPNRVWNDKKLSEDARKETAHRMVEDILFSTNLPRDYVVNGKLTEVYSPGQKVMEKYRKRGYDAIEDVQDQLSSTESFNPEAPLIVLNGSKFKITDTKIANRKKFAKGK